MMATGPLLYKIITPRLQRTPRMRGELLAAMRNTEKAVLADYQSTVETWNHNVEFAHKFFTKGGHLNLSVYALDYVWNLLDQGTSVRYAVMEPGFVPKTRPGRIRSMAGNGGKWFVGHKPRPGIIARDWNTLIRAKNSVEFGQRIARAIFMGLR
jgi:hypothetical protein